MKMTLALLLSAFFVVGCTSYRPAPEQYVQVKKPVKKAPKPRKKSTPKAPKKEHELKVVEDENFSSDYMYPQTAKKKNEKPVEVVTQDESAVMTKEKCIALIGQEKFDNYTQMYESENAALKKCKMLQSL